MAGPARRAGHRPARAKTTNGAGQEGEISAEALEHVAGGGALPTPGEQATNNCWGIDDGCS